MRKMAYLGHDRIHIEMSEAMTFIPLNYFILIEVITLIERHVIQTRCLIKMRHFHML